MSRGRTVTQVARNEGSFAFPLGSRVLGLPEKTGTPPTEQRAIPLFPSQDQILCRT